MLELNNVVVVLDPEQEQQPALDKVLTLAKLADFDITLLSAEYTQYLVEGYYFDAIDLPTLRQEHLASRKQTLEDLAGPLRDNGLTVETLAVWGHPAYEVVVREAVRLNADLVVQHTRQHSAVSRLLLTHNDWQLVRCCPMPLLLVKETDWQHDPVILAAVDPKHSRNKPVGLDHKILQIAVDMANLTEGEAHVLHSFSPVPLTGKQLKQAREEHRVAFDALLTDFDIPEDHQYLVDEAPEYALTQTASEVGADIVVMGAISRSILTDVFLGNTTEQVLDFLDADVLIVKPNEFQTPVKIDTPT